MIMCSRLDLFHTGTTSTPASEAITQACSCAAAWCANLSPTPIENFGSCIASLTVSSPYAMPSPGGSFTTSALLLIHATRQKTAVHHNGLTARKRSRLRRQVHRGAHQFFRLAEPPHWSTHPQLLPTR